MSEVVRNYEKRTGYSVHSRLNQLILGDFVNKHIYHNVSSLISSLAEEDYEIGREAKKLYQQTDFQQAARDEVEDIIDKEFDKFLNASVMDRIVDLIVDNLEENESLEDFCVDRNVDIEQYESDALQHYTVSEWLADALQARGEIVDANFYGLCIWGRKTAEQAVKLDSVIAEIAIRQDILLGQRGCAYQEEEISA